LSQNTCPIPQLSQPYHDIIGFKGNEFLAIRPATQAGGPSLVGCPQQLIHYTRSYHPHLQIVPTFRNPGMRDAAVRWNEIALILT